MNNIPILLNDNKEEIFRFNCPNCSVILEVLKKDVNCTIFRHGVFKETWTLIPPHASKEQILKWIELDKIIGCGKPFKLTISGELSICGYI
jgi:hypothetical protein